MQIRFINFSNSPHKVGRQFRKSKTTEARAGVRARDARTRTHVRARVRVYTRVTHVRTRSVRVCNTHEPGQAQAKRRGALSGSLNPGFRFFWWECHIFILPKGTLLLN